MHITYFTKRTRGAPNDKRSSSSSSLSAMNDMITSTSSSSIRVGCLLAFILLAAVTIHTFPTTFAQFQQPSSDNVYQREHSLVKPYQGSGMTIPNWEFFGSTIVTSNYIRLTQDTQSRQGGIWNVVPYQSKYWQVEVAFRVHGHGSELFGDGLALWYVKEPPKGGPIFGNRDYFTGLTVVLDTYANQNGVHSHGHPYISAMVNNGTQHYDHENDGVNSELAGCECKFRGLEHEARILVQYYNEELIIKTDIENSGIWRDCLSVKGVYLPTHYYFGITSATGDLSDNHDILSIKMRQLSSTIYDHQPKPDDLPRADYSLPNRDKLNDTPSGMSALRKLFLVVCVIAGVVAVAGFGYFLYQSKRNTARKRFY
uniref:VIP36-like protein n=1 Tax=Aceria tosichella TaxID=561515 RepID=A0A6G1S9P6_9ACAR